MTMKYKELIQFDPIDEIIKFGKLDDEDYRAKLVRNFVCSTAYEDRIIPQICSKLDLNASTETKGIQIVGNYGTGKSHLMSLFSIIAENADYLPMVQSAKAKDWLKTIAGKYLVYRFELGHTTELWDVVTYYIDQALASWGVDYCISEDASHASYYEKLQKMMAAFEDKYPDKGFMLVVDEMLSYLKGRSEPSKLNRDLQVLQALGHMSDRTHFRMVFGVQELIYRSPEFQFAKDMLSHVNERYIDLTIQKEDVQFIVQKRLLQKDEHQKAWIRTHLKKFAAMFPQIGHNLESYVNLFPVHPSYFENFSLIRIGKSQREVLKTLSNKFKSIIEDEVPEKVPGLICYDSYWQDMVNNVDLKADPDVSKVCDIVEIVDQKIEDNFIRGLVSKKPLAHRIVSAAAIKILQGDLSKQNGVTADALANDLCYVDEMCDTYDELVEDVFEVVLDAVKDATQGEYFDNKSNEYHLRLEGGKNYENDVKVFAASMGTSQKDEYFYKFLAEIFMLGEQTYRPTFRIWPHSIEWQSHKCTRAGYIFMGDPNSRSTTHPEQHFYIYFMPIFNLDGIERLTVNDSVYFLMDGLDEAFKNNVSLYGASVALEGDAPSDEKPKFKQLREKYYREARNLFNNQFLPKTVVEYMGEQHPMASMPGAQADTLIDSVSQITSFIMEQQFTNENPNYPSFSALPQPLCSYYGSSSNRENLLRAARQKIASPSAAIRNGEAILMGLKLWEDGRINTEHSPYARSLKTKLAAKGGMVLNRDEILEIFYAATNEYISTDFHIEADLEMLVMAAMAQQGEIEIVLNGGNRINASTIANINNINSNDNYTFLNICPPKGLNIALIREIMLGILGTDRTGELDDRESSVFADLCTQAQLLENRVVRIQHEIMGGYTFAGDIVIVTEDEARDLNNTFDVLKGICNQIQRYNTKAKMRNIEWPIEVVRKAMTETKKKLEELEAMIKELGEFRNIISYLRTALSNIPDSEFKTEISTAVDELASVVTQTQTVRDTYKSKLETLRGRYADWYMEEYVKAHISSVDAGKLQRLMNCDNKRVCDIVNEASFVMPLQYDQWKQKAAKLKPANPSVTRQAILNIPTSVDGFNPTIQVGVMPTISELEDELDIIYNSYDQQFHDALEDPTTERNKEMLTDGEKTTIQQFAEGTIKLDLTYAHTLVDIIKKLQHSFTRIEIGSAEIGQIFSRPMNKQQALDALAQYIDAKSRGHRPEDIRIIIRINNE